MMLLREAKMAVTGAPGLPEPYPAEAPAEPRPRLTFSNQGRHDVLADLPWAVGPGGPDQPERADAERPRGHHADHVGNGRGAAPGGDVPRLDVRPGDDRPGAGAGLYRPGRPDPDNRQLTPAALSPAILELWLPLCPLHKGLFQPQLQDRGEKCREGPLEMLRFVESHPPDDLYSNERPITGGE